MRLDIPSAIKYLQSLLPSLEPLNRNLAKSLIEYLETCKDKEIVLQEFYDVLVPHGTPESQRVIVSKFIKAINTLAREESIPFSIVRDKSKKKPIDRIVWFEGRSMSEEEIQKVNEYETSALKETPAPLSGNLGDIPLYKVFFSHADADRELVEDLLKRMEPYSKTKDLTLDFWLFRKELVRGEDSTEFMLNDLDEADVVLFAVSPTFTTRDFILEYELPRGLKKINVPFFLTKPDLSLLENHHDKNVRNLKNLWLDSIGYSQQKDDDEKNDFAKKLVADIIKRIEKKKRSCENIESYKLDDNLDEAVEQEGEISYGLTPKQSNIVDIQTTLKDWYLDNRESKNIKYLQTDRWPKLLALLGDYGAGKTWSCMQFVKEIEDITQKNSKLPKPLFLNLKRVNEQEDVDIKKGYSLKDIISYCLGDTSKKIDINELIEQIKEGKYIVIFDGLDEVLVHLTPKQSNTFIHTLLKLREGNSNTKMLLACRTHYFKNIEEQKDLFVEQDRESISEKEYFMLTLRPMNWKQIEEYVKKNLPDITFESFKKTIKSIHNLEGLVTKPFHLKLISEQISELQELKLQGKPINASSLYETIVNKSFSRDNGKHTIMSEHKIALLEELAY